MLKCNPCTLSYGSVAVGGSKTLSLTLKNSASTSLKITRYNKSGASFAVTSPALPVILAAGATKPLTIAFKPTSTSTESGKLYVENTKSSIGLLIQLSGTSAASGGLAANPTTVNFGTVAVGSSTSQFASIKNTGSASVKLLSSSITGPGFSKLGLTLPLTLKGGQSITFTTKFTPKAAGTATGSISVTSGVSTVVIKLSGTGGSTGSLSAAPTSLSFGSVTVGSQKSMTGTLTASGSSVTVSSAASSTTEFALSGISFPLALSAGQSKSYTVVFKPASSGTATANLKFTTGSGATVSQALTGNGASASSHSVSLAWNPSKTAAVVGYNIYRGAVTGGPYTRVNSALEASTAYSDTNVLAGKTYFYVVTAVDGGGTESGYSNQVKAIIPSP